MNDEQYFYELELRWVRLFRTTRNPRLRVCADAAARREEELRVILGNNSAGRHAFANGDTTRRERTNQKAGRKNHPRQAPSRIREKS